MSLHSDIIATVKTNKEHWRKMEEDESTTPIESDNEPYIWVILARCRSFGFEAAKFRIGLVIIILCFAWWCEP